MIIFEFKYYLFNLFIISIIFYEVFLITKNLFDLIEMFFVIIVSDYKRIRYLCKLYNNTTLINKIKLIK